MRKPRSPAREDASARNEEPSATGRRGKRARREAKVQSSVSLPPTQWERVDVLGDLTRWGRSGTVEQAVELMLNLPVPVVQRLAVLRRTTAHATLRDRLRAVFEQAIEETQATLPDDPWGEYDVALRSVGHALARSPAATMTEEERIAEARRETLAFRRAGAVRGGLPDE